MYYHYNENFKETFVDDNDSRLKNKGLDYKLKFKISKVFEFYFKHFQGSTVQENSIYILTSNSQTKKAYFDILGEFLPRDKIQNYVLDLNEYIALHQDDFPELVNFIGFDEENEGDEDEDVIDEDKKLYQDHLDYEQMVLGVKQGQYFQGRLNISRLVQTEAVIKVQGLNQDIHIQNLQDQNRAVNGDIVCVEILPESQWC